MSICARKQHISSSRLARRSLQWGVIRCCQVWSAGACFENVLGVVQIGITVVCFNLILILYLYYFPAHRKYVHLIAIQESDPDAEPLPGSYNPQAKRSTQQSWTHKVKSAFWPSLSTESTTHRTKTASRRSSASSASSDFDPRSVLLPSLTRDAKISLSPDYRLSLAIAWIVVLHTVLSTFITLLLLIGLPKFSNIPDEQPYPHEPRSVWVVEYWATFLGMEATVLACFQYLPQLWKTYNTRLVGSLSIPTMVIQARKWPSMCSHECFRFMFFAAGSFLFVYNFIGRPGVNYSTWLNYLLTGVLQLILLFMCIAWKIRQR